jgi:hypothetical protein
LSYNVSFIGEVKVTDWTHPDWDKCICQGKGYYMHADPPEYQYSIQDETHFTTPEIHRLACQYHSGEIAVSDIRWELPNGQWQVEAAPGRPQPALTIPDRYPDGWWPEDVRQWCIEHNYVVPEWARENVEDFFWFGSPGVVQPKVGYLKWSDVYPNPTSWGNTSYSTYGVFKPGTKVKYPGGETIEENISFQAKKGVVDAVEAAYEKSLKLMKEQYFSWAYGKKQKP